MLLSQLLLAALARFFAFARVVPFVLALETIKAAEGVWREKSIFGGLSLGSLVKPASTYWLQSTPTQSARLFYVDRS